MRQDPAIIHEARVLRQVPLPIEAALWQDLRDRRFRGLKFRRQADVGGRVVAFFCAAERLAILVDGGKNGYSSSATYLDGSGLRVIVMDDAQITCGLASVLQRIAAALDDRDRTG